MYLSIISYTNNAWLEGDLEEWQTQEVNVTRGEAKSDIDRGEAEGDIDLEALFFLLFPTGLDLLFHANINIHYFYNNIFIFMFCQHMQSVPLPLPWF